METFFEHLFDRFHELHKEIENALTKLPPQALDWKPGMDMNSVAVIVVHLIGAERYWIGDVVMGEPSNRKREAEFRAAGLSAAELTQRLIDLEGYEKAVFETLSFSDLQSERLSPRYGSQYTVGSVLYYVLAHTALHIGHIQITAQLWKQNQA